MTSPDFKNPDGEARAICVFCGSGAGASPEFTEAARLVGALLAQKGVGLVYGGGDIGLMGEVARSALAHGGRVTGIIPDFLIRREHMPDPAEQGRETIIVSDMHTRKRLMYERADAFLALPGGIGTLEELVEQMTWSQLGQHTRPIMVLNTLGFWDPLFQLLRHMRQAMFLRPGLDASYMIAAEPAGAIDALLAAIASTRAAMPEPGDDRPPAPGPF
ncbi:TIGR00730 family Rossman fold protein [Camelimonas lactis]|uniref:Cytokinin riboside 5'-monophosphate phosphoribohydrolase n=1 Tax=Camelimonas lactis TaxID=659006 RepID=A0A4R2GRX3_9HYPH|nr:TIGR00730 family Rossman fold protein [Camelimonas lactis]TCO12009.1 hypothetical protein EV666_11047 [Camelimonas lactis]